MIRKLLIFTAIAMLFLGVQAGTAGADLVTNGSFQTGDLNGWNLSNPANTYYFITTADAGGPAGNEIELTTNGLGTDTQITQSIATMAGHIYTVTFWLANDDPTNSSSFLALGNGNVETLTMLTSNGSLPNASLSNAFDYNEFQFTDLATSSATTIAFDFQNDNSYYHLTDVSATVPEPSAILLLGPGLGCLAGLRYRRKKAA